MTILKLTVGGDRRKNPEQKTFRPMSKNEVLLLCSGNHVWFKANDGTARHLKINGVVRTWKKDPNRIEVPTKYGMYEYHTFCTEDLDRLLIEVEEKEKDPEQMEKDAMDYMETIY